MGKNAVIGSTQSGRMVISQALANMTGYNIIPRPTYVKIAMKYGLNINSNKCEWPDSFVYVIGSFTERVMIEQNYGENFISDGSAFDELVWIKCRYANLELIYERSMVLGLEKIMAEYVKREYDNVFRITMQQTDEEDKCLEDLMTQYKIPYTNIDGSDKEKALEQIVNYLDLKPIYPPGVSLIQVY